MLRVRSRAFTFPGLAILLVLAFSFEGAGKGISRAFPGEEKKTDERRETVRKPAVAGMFYESNPARLKEEIRGYLEKAHPRDVHGELIALVSPHAGYRFSGQAAAYGFKLVDPARIKRAVVLAPSHSVGFRGASIPDVRGYETPLGEVFLDRDARGKLMEHTLVTSIPEAHSREHSLEVQIPFLQAILGQEFRLVPLVVGQLREGDDHSLAVALREIVKKGDLVVVSSDFTHQGPRFGYVPYRENVKENIKSLDMGAVKHILEKDAKKFTAYVEETGATICGRFPISILLHLLPESAEGNLLTYYTSGDVLGDETDTVSYAAIAFGSPGGWEKEK